jgi:hypothetical protein
MCDTPMKWQPTDMKMNPFNQIEGTAGISIEDFAVQTSAVVDIPAGELVPGPFPETFRDSTYGLWVEDKMVEFTHVVFAEDENVGLFISQEAAESFSREGDIVTKLTKPVSYNFDSDSFSFRGEGGSKATSPSEVIGIW